MSQKMNFLTRVYWISIFFLVCLLIATPYLAHERIHASLDNSLDLAESVMLAVLVIIGFGINRFYHTELDRRQQDIDGMLDYIGHVNVQIHEMRESFRDIKKYPESKSDLKYIYEILAKRVLAMVNAEWVLFRIVDVPSRNTLSEYLQTRGASLAAKCEVSNKDLVEDRINPGYSAVRTSQDNFDIRAFCVLPKRQLNGDQRVFIGRIVNDLGMLYLIFSSAHYKNNRDADKPERI